MWDTLSGFIWSHLKEFCNTNVRKHGLKLIRSVLI